MQKNHFLSLKKFKNTESSQLCAVSIENSDLWASAQKSAILSGTRERTGVFQVWALI